MGRTMHFFKCRHNPRNGTSIHRYNTDGEIGPSPEFGLRGKRAQFFSPDWNSFARRADPVDSPGFDQNPDPFDHQPATGTYHGHLRKPLCPMIYLHAQQSPRVRTAVLWNFKDFEALPLSGISSAISGLSFDFDPL